MFQGIKNGADLIKKANKVLVHHPRFLIPLLITWLIYAPIVLYFKYGFNWDAYGIRESFGIVFGIIFLFAFLLSFSCSILLEIIQQLESDQNISLLKAFNHTVRYNILKIIPLVFIWAIIWFLITVIQALLSKKEESKKPFSAESAAKTLAGFDKFSLSRSFFEALEKGVRMVMFLILPAIAWENLGFWESMKKGFGIFKAHLSEFATGFVLTEAAALIIFLPPGILFYISGELNMPLPDPVWVATIIYTAVAWSYLIYLEQMFTAELYLWHLRWEDQMIETQEGDKIIPSIKDVPRPSVLDEVHELVDKASD